MSDKKILLMLYPNCISFETMLAVEILGERYSVEVITTDNKIHTDASGLLIKPHLSFEKVQIDNYVALLIPGGNPDAIIGQTQVQHLIRKFHTARLIVAGICAGVLVLADSGILKGHKITHNYLAKYASEEVVKLTTNFWNGTDYEDSLCVVSGNIVTAMPNGYIEFATTLAEKLGIHSVERAKQMNRYYKGFPIDNL